MTTPFILIIGNRGVGISTLVDELFPLTDEVTVSSNPLLHYSRDEHGRSIMVELFEEHARWSSDSEWLLVMNKADAFLLAFALDDAASWTAIEQHLALVRTHGRPELPVFVVGLKADLVAPENRSMEKFESFAASFGLTFMAICAPSGSGVSALHDMLAAVPVSSKKVDSPPLLKAIQRPAEDVEVEPEKAKKATSCMLL
jgi:putative ribosome biogenesis GTPase RsgA